MEPDAARSTRRHRRILWIILAVAVLLRVVNYSSLADGPCLLHHSVSDMAFFAKWSEIVADGDVLTDRELHPLHSWHRRVAALHLARHSDRIGGRDIRTLSRDERTEQYRALWNEWYGGKTFHQEPLYPYALATIRRVLGPDESWVHVAQMLLGIGILLLLHSVTKARFGPVAALVATGGAALCAPLIFFELYMLRATPIALATLALLALFDRTARARTRRRWLLFGLAIGVAMTLKMHFFAFGIVAAGLLCWPMRRDVMACLRSAGLFAGGVLLGFTPVLVRNLLVGAPVFSATSVGPVTFANSNHAAYVGFGWAENNEAMEMLERIMSSHGGSFLGTVAATIGTHDSVAGWLALLWTKFQLALHWAEFPNNVSFYFVEPYSTVLTVLPVTFTVIATLALGGCVAALLTKRMPYALVVFVVLSLMQLVVFYNLARFRIALMVTLLPLAAYGATWLWRELRGRRTKSAIPVLFVCGAFAWWLQRPIPPNMTLDSSAPFGNALAHFYRPQWSKLVAAEDWERGRRILADAIAARPGFLDSIGPAQLPDSMSKLTITQIYVEHYANYAKSLHELGRTPEASAAKNRADALYKAWQTVEKQRRK